MRALSYHCLWNVATLELFVAYKNNECDFGAKKNILNTRRYMDNYLCPS
jgi:hypothetical protein